MDKIYIEGLEVSYLIGVYAWERENNQRLLVDLALQADLSRAALSDNVEDTLNYAEISAKVIAVAADSRFKLIEALASHILNTVLEAFPAVKVATIKLSKPDILANANNVAVEFSKGRDV